MRALLSLFCCLAAAACSNSPTIVVVQRLEPGGGGGQIQARPTFDVVIKIKSDATDFEPEDIMRFLVNGVDETLNVRVGGEWGVFRVDPAGVGVFDVALQMRDGEGVDRFTWTVQPYTGPTLTGVSAPEAQVGSDITLTGTGFDGGALRVFVGGAEADIVSSTATTIVVTVPPDAIPGIFYVLVGAEAAEGIVDFQPLDQADEPIGFPESNDPILFAIFPAHGPVGTPTRVWGRNFDDDSAPRLLDEISSRFFDVRNETLPTVTTGVRSAFMVVHDEVPVGTGILEIRDGGDDSNPLPFTVDPD